MSDLKTTVWVTDESGQPVSFGPGDDVPAWAKEQMGDHCFVANDKPEPAKRAAVKK